MNRTIILVDDDPQVNALNKKLIFQNFDNINVVELKNGNEFYDFVFNERKFNSNNQAKADYVFMDVLMPEMGGLETIAKIKERDYDLFKSLKISVLTSVVSVNINKNLKDLSVINYIQKPLRLATLERILLQN